LIHVSSDILVIFTNIRTIDMITLIYLPLGIEVIIRRSSGKLECKNVEDQVYRLKNVDVREKNTDVRIFPVAYFFALNTSYPLSLNVAMVFNKILEVLSFCSESLSIVVISRRL